MILAVMLTLLAAAAAAAWALWPRDGRTQDVPPITRGGGGRPSGEKGVGGKGVSKAKEPADPVLNDDLARVVVLTPDEKTPALTRIGRIEAPAACVFAPGRGPVFTTSMDGRLLAHDGATLAPLGECILPGPAYHLALDAARGVLYAAVARRASLRPRRLGPPEMPPADVLAFDVSAVLEGGRLAGRMAATRRHDAGRQIVALCLSGDGGRLYFLATTGESTEAVALDAPGWAVVGRRQLPPGGLPGLAVDQRGGRVYLLGGGRLTALSQGLDVVVARATVGASCSSPVALGGRVMLIDRRLGIHLMAVDLDTRRVLSRWDLSLEGLLTLRATEDGGRVVLASSAVIAGKVLVIDARGGRPVLGGETKGGGHLVRGAVTMNGDGTVILLGNGDAYRVGP